MKLNNDYPIPSNIFSKRFELSYVLKEGTEKQIIPIILSLDKRVKQTNEILINTYFDQILKYQPNYSYIIRFRQRAPFNIEGFPKTFEFKGAGAIEIKKRNHHSIGNDVIKTGTFFSNEEKTNIRNLLENTTDYKKVFSFIKKANDIQNKKTPSKDLFLINPNDFAKIARDLHLFATRICIRQTFVFPVYKNAKITIESKPTFYAFPIMRKAHTGQTKIKFPKAHITEQAKRTKIEIKAQAEDVAKTIYKPLAKIIETTRIPKDAYSHEPFYKMIVRTSKKVGTLIDESEGNEVEAKANLSSTEDIRTLITKIQHKLLESKKGSYVLFPTEYHISMRGYAEKNRTVYGWKDVENNWHEIATIIRMNEKDAKERGFEAILKWKGDPISDDITLKRKTSLEYLKKEPDENKFIKKLCQTTHRKVLAVGTGKKTKFRIYVQDRDGRNYCVSLDNMFVSAQNQLQQLEVEYVHTVSLNSDAPTTSLTKACELCIRYFSDMLTGFGVKVIRTPLRKIDFLAANCLD